MEGEQNKKVFGNFKIYSFNLVHDVPCCGYYILHPDIGSLVYLSDTEYCKYKFPKVNHILVESNYDKRVFNENHPTKEHIFKGHMELQTTKNFVKANKSMELRNVILCHLSADNADPEVMKKEIQVVAGQWCNVAVAEPGLELVLSKYPW